MKVSDFSPAVIKRGLSGGKTAFFSIRFLGGTKHWAATSMDAWLLLSSLEKYR